MEHWLRFQYQDQQQFGLLLNDKIQVYTGDMFNDPIKTDQEVLLADVEILMPCVPRIFLGLWNNFHERARVEGLSKPPHPLYFVKTANTYSADKKDIERPVGYQGDIAFEAELGVVIGKECSFVSSEQAEDYIFGYTCVNDVTARGIFATDNTFAQWTRAKGFDTFAPFGPYIVSGINSATLTVKAIVNGVEKQNYPVSDMFYSPQEIVSLISQDMTLMAGDIIACGTSVGAEPMTNDTTIDVVIDGVGLLRNSLR